MWYVGVFKLKNYFYGIWNYSCHGSITKIHFFFHFLVTIAVVATILYVVQFTGILLKSPKFEILYIQD